MSPVRPAAAFIHGEAGLITIFTARYCYWLTRYANLEEAAREHGTDPQIQQHLLATRVLATRWADSIGVTPTTPSSEERRSPQTGPYSTAQAAVQLGVTPRAVRKAIAVGRIEANRECGTWHIDSAAIALYRSRVGSARGT